MAQGGKIKLAKAKKSGGSQKRKAVKKPSKGWKHHAAKGRKAAVVRREVETSKAINKRNEAVASAKAINAGNSFFLSDLKQKGDKELKQQARERSKKENKATKVSDRLKQQLHKLETGG
jgi:hypothetical protein